MTKRFLCIPFDPHPTRRLKWLTYGTQLWDSKLKFEPSFLASKSSTFSPNWQNINKEMLWNIESTVDTNSIIYTWPNLIKNNSTAIFCDTRILTIQSDDNGHRNTDWRIGFLFLIKRLLVIFQLVYPIERTSMWKSLPLKLGAYIATYWCDNGYTYIFQHFKYMHCLSVNYEVKFHLFFLIFPLASPHS